MTIKDDPINPGLLDEDIADTQEFLAPEEDLEDVLKRKIGEYSELSAEQEYVEKKQAAMRDTLLKNPEYIQVSTRCNEVLEKLKALRQEIDEISLDMYSESGNKHPLGCITVTNTTALDYEIDKAIDFCIHHFRGALELNRTKFEKYVRATMESNPMEFVRIKFQQKVRLATNLDDYKPIMPY